MKLQLNQIKPNPEQPRSVIDQAGLESLAESIREHGLLNPISVEGPQEDGTYYILDGERRWRAHQIAGLEEIEAYIARPALNGSGDVERLLLGIIGNLQRQDMNLIERASGYQRLRDFGMTQTEIGKACGMAPSMVSTNIKLLALPLDIQQLYAQGKLPFDPRLVNLWAELYPDVAVRLARRAAAAEMTTKRIVYLAKKLTGQPSQKNYGKQSKHAKSNPVFTAKAEFGHWNALAMLKLQGAAVQDEKIKNAAIQTCQACALYEDASQNVCRDCPAVELIRRLM